MELHHSQTRMIREQLTSILRGLDVVREDVNGLALQRDGDKAHLRALREELQRHWQGAHDEVKVAARQALAAGEHLKLALEGQSARTGERLEHLEQLLGGECGARLE